jgi:hypothetical protein
MLTRYQPGGLADARVLGAWRQMLASGDLERGFGLELTALSRFFFVLQPPTDAWLAHDGEDVWGLFWAEPASLHATYFSCWVRADRRGTKACLAAVLTAFREALAAARTLVVFTNRPALGRLYRRLGFLKGGELPEAWNGETAHFWYLTRAALAATERRYPRVAAVPAQACA